MAPRLEFAPEFLTELLAGLVHGYVVVAVSFPDQRIGYSCHRGGHGMILASGVDYDDLGRQCLHKERVAGVEIAVVVGFHHRDLAADLGDRSLEIPFLRLEDRPVPAGKIASVEVGEFPVAQTDGAGVHILIEQGRIPAVHLHGFLATAGPDLAVHRQIPDLEVFGESPRVVHHHKLPLAPDGELLHRHSVLRGIVDEVDVMLDETLVRVEDIVPGRKIVVRICPVNQLVEMNILAREGDSGKRVAVRARNRILYRADVVVMKMGDHRIVKVLLVRKL